MASQTSRFIETLSSSGPAADRADKLKLYSRFIGDWTFDATVNKDDGTQHRGQGEIHFAWVLDGRAIQDVWILPGLFYGSTLRVYDPGIDGWHILWSDPLKQLYTRQIGRAQGRDIVQLGDAAGVHIRWSFSEITADSFRWRGERSTDGGATWFQQSDFHARRN
ncbi:MAG: hypothetical protein JSR61_03095 [Proteobacteria bacterium]|nr:hypothetical protein [Pseudomonadota bacterium]